MLKKWLAPGAGVLAASLLCAAPGGPAPFLGGAAEAASFNCAKAANPTEAAICANPELSALDTTLAGAYARRLAADPAVRQVQRAWILDRNAGCGKDAACLGRMMNAELDWLNRGGSPPAALPTKPGACALTAVKRVETRLSDATNNEMIPGSGSAIEETDGGYQVSYDTLPAIDGSRRGDPVLLCLISIPHPCPPGDNRGRVYAGADLRTLKAWSQADAEHMCGGA
jgi:uncharacterized protein